MTTGRVVKFDEYAGYGFARPDSGGEDVFVHVNDLLFDKSLLRPGVRLEFAVEDSSRGPKASQVSLLEESPVPLPGQMVYEPDPEGSPAAAPTIDSAQEDVGITARQLIDEVTEMLLTAAPEMTSAEILRVRDEFVKLAERHSWLVS